MARKKLTSRRMMAASRRRSVFFGDKASSTYKGGGFLVKYKMRGSQMVVTVTLENHGRVEFDCMNVLPSAGLAKIHSEVAFRSHFKVQGDPHEFELKFLACACASHETKERPARKGKK